MIEPGSLDAWKPVASYGLSAGLVRTWSPHAAGTETPPEHRAGLVRLRFQSEVLRFILPPPPGVPELILPAQPIDNAKRQGTRWLNRIAQTHTRRGVLSGWQSLPREQIPQLLRSWYGPGGAEATLSMLITPGGVVLECCGRAAGTRRTTAPFLALLPFPADATQRGLEWLDEAHTALLP